VESFPALTVLPLPLTGELTNSQPSFVSRARIASDSSTAIEEQSTSIFGRGPEAAAVLAAELAALDVRYAGSSVPDGVLEDPEHPARSRIWLRAGDRLPDDDALHRCVLAYMSDLTLLHASLVPHRLDIDSTMRASIDHAVWFHRPFRADEWLLYDQISPSAGGARGLSIGRLFAADGALVATASQEGLIRPTHSPRAPG